MTTAQILMPQWSRTTALSPEQPLADQHELQVSAHSCLSIMTGCVAPQPAKAVIRGLRGVSGCQGRQSGQNGRS